METGAIVVFAVGGVLLVIAEIFIPGGIVGTLGGIMLAIAIVAGFLEDPALGGGLLLGSLVFGMLALWAWVKIIPGTALGRRFILQADAGAWDGFDPGKRGLMGKAGTARTPLHPGGIAIIDQKRIDVVTRGELIDSGTRIKVIAVEGNRVVVTAA